MKVRLLVLNILLGIRYIRIYCNTNITDVTFIDNMVIKKRLVSLSNLKY